MDKRVFDEALASLPPALHAAKPFAALLLGSGWNQAAAGLRIECEVPYSDIAGFGAATVVGHAGRLLLARTKRGGQVLVFCGRRQWYEGCEWEQVVMPAVLAHRLGAPVFLVTNAAGGIRASLQPGDMVILRDHLRLSPLTPLRGPHDPEFGPRFPDQSRVYDPALVELLRAAGALLSLMLALVVAVNVGFANMCYLKLQLQYENACAFYTALSAQIVQTEGFDESCRLAFIGRQDNLLHSFPELDTELLQGPDRDLVNIYSRENFLRYYLGFDIPFASEEETEKLAEDPRVLAMAEYPYYGSVQKIDDFIVVRLG